MKRLNKYIQEKLIINKNYKMYNYYPNDKDELKFAIQRHYNKGIYNLNDIDVSNIDDFSDLFFGDENTKMEEFDISDWNVSNGVDFSWMFSGCSKFNCDLSRWNVSNGITFKSMFYACYDFNSDLSQWNISKNANTRDMLYGCPIDDKYKPKGVE